MAGHYTVPMVVEQRPTGERAADVFSRLLSERIIFLGTEIDDDVANVTTPVSILRVKFRATKFGPGYDQDEVDDLLDQVVANLKA